MKSLHVLGVNARNQLYLPYNKASGRKITDNKLAAKKRLKKFSLPVPKTLAVLKTSADVENFAWEDLPDNFVVKPRSGYGGGGIIIIKKKAKWAGEWRLMDDSIIKVNDLKFRAFDILAGQYSLRNEPDQVMIEERIKIRKIFFKYAHQGTPDIRVMVFNKVPVAAMLRLPTAQSKGKGNLHQGGIAVGIDLATGITTQGVLNGKFIKTIPLTKKKINGLKIPNWNQILTLAVKCQEAVPSLGFLGVDLVLDKERGPLILELNARPGLEIQNANLAPLRRRLERVEGLEVRSAEHGVRIAKSLFAERFADRVMVEEGIKTLRVWENVKVLASDGKTKTEIRAKIDTGAWKTSIDKVLAQNLGLLEKSNVLWTKFYKSSLGREERDSIGLTFYIAGRKIKTVANVADRITLRTPLIIGRRDLSGFVVRPRK